MGTSSKAGSGAWRQQAACSGADPLLFTDPRGSEDVRKALQTCAVCTVRHACLQAALGHSRDADVGIWGGTTEHTRNRIRTGRLTVTEAPEADLPLVPPEQDRQRETVHAKHALPAPAGRSATDQPLLLTVGRDRYGNFTDAAGRVLICRIPGRRYLLLIDGQQVATTHTLTQARQIAWTTLHRPDRSAALPIPAVSTSDAPAIASPELLRSAASPQASRKAGRAVMGPSSSVSRTELRACRNRRAPWSAPIRLSWTGLEPRRALRVPSPARFPPMVSRQPRHRRRWR